MSSCESMCVSTGVSWSICPHPTQGLWAADTCTHIHTHTVRVSITVRTVKTQKAVWNCEDQLTCPHLADWLMLESNTVTLQKQLELLFWLLLLEQQSPSSTKTRGAAGLLQPGIKALMSQLLQWNQTWSRFSGIIILAAIIHDRSPSLLCPAAQFFCLYQRVPVQRK